MKRIILIIVLLAGINQLTNAQNIPLSSQYLVNKFYLSPSYAGVEDAIPVFLGYRNQWSGFPGAPITKMVNGNVPVLNKVGIGASIISDKTDIFNNFFAGLTYAYHMKIGEYQFVDFSLTGSAIENNIDFSKIIAEDPNDPYLNQKEKYNEMVFNAGAALLFRFSDFHAGISMPYIARNKSHYSTENNLDQYLIQRMIVFHGSYNLKLGADWQFEPFFVGRKSEFAPFNYDIAGLLRYKNAYWFGGLYRNSKDIVITAGMKLDERVVINYAYEWGKSKIAKNSDGTHEITLGFYIGKDAKKKQEEQLKKEKVFTKATKDFQEELIEQKKQKEVLNEKVDSLYARLYAAEKQINNMKTTQVEITETEPVVIDKTTKKKEVKPKVKKGEKVDKAVLGKYFVVVQSFGVKANAERAQTTWEEKGYNVTIVYSNIRDKYYISAGKFNSKKEATKLKNSIKDKGIDCWIYHFLPE